MLVPQSGNAAVQPVEYKGGRHQRRGREQIGHRPATHVDHAEQHGCHPAAGIAQSNEIGQVKLANHGEVLGGLGRRRCRTWAHDSPISFFVVIRYMKAQTITSLSITLNPNITGGMSWPRVWIAERTPKRNLPRR